MIAAISIDNRQHWQAQPRARRPSQFHVAKTKAVAPAKAPIGDAHEQKQSCGESRA